MSDTQAEHRGWEIEYLHHTHFFDDPNYVFDGEEERVRWFWGVLGLMVALCLGTYLLGIWLQPPPVVFSAPVPPAFAANPANYSNTVTCSLTGGTSSGMCTLGNTFITGTTGTNAKTYY